MFDSLYLAGRYLSYYRIKTAILVAALSTTLFLPAGLHVLVDTSARQLRSRAVSTPLVVGAPGSPLELVLNSLYFESRPPVSLPAREWTRLRGAQMGPVVPLSVRFRARQFPIVGTSLEYFEWRGLRVAAGRSFGMLGECVLGHQVARALGLQPGHTLLSTPDNLFDLAGAYPLQMHVVGILAATGTADDRAVFVDVRTDWIMQGLGHGHQDLARESSPDLVLERQEKTVTASAALVQYTEITAENVHSFHFHGDTEDFPLTAVVVAPRDDKSRALLLGRYQRSSTSAQMVEPAEVIEELLATVFRVQTFVLVALLLVASATVLSVALVMLLSLRLRQREIATMTKLGCSRGKIVSMVVWELVVVLTISIVVAAALTQLTRWAGPLAIRFFLR